MSNRPAKGTNILELVLDVGSLTSEASAQANQPTAGNCGKSSSGSSSRRWSGTMERGGPSATAGLNSERGSSGGLGSDESISGWAGGAVARPCAWMLAP